MSGGEHGARADAGGAVDLREADPRLARDLPLPASPRSCVTTSNTWRRPDAPTGSPFARQPPSVLTGRRPPMLVAPRGVQLRLLAVLAEPALGEVDQLGPRLGVLHLDDVDVAGSTPAVSKASRAASTVGDGAISSGSDGLKTSNVPARRVRKTADRSHTGRASGSRARYSRRQTRAPPRPSPGEQSMYWVSGCASIARAEDLVDGERPAAPGVRRQRAVRERLHRDLRQRLHRDRVVVHVPLQLRAEELRRHHQAVRPYQSGSDQSAGSFWKAPRGCLSKPTTSADLGRARLERPHRGDERRAAGRAAVLDVDEREPGRPEVGDHRVGVAGVLAAAVGELDVAPGDAGVCERARARRGRPSPGR